MRAETRMQVVLAFVLGCGYRPIEPVTSDTIGPQGSPAAYGPLAYIDNGAGLRATDDHHRLFNIVDGKRYNKYGEVIWLSTSVTKDSTGKVLLNGVYLTESEMEQSRANKIRFQENSSAPASAPPEPSPDEITSRRSAITDPACHAEDLYLYTISHQRGDRICIPPGDREDLYEDCHDPCWFLFYDCGCNKTWGEALKYGSYWGGAYCSQISFDENGSSTGYEVGPYYTGDFVGTYNLDSAYAYSYGSCETTIPHL